MDDLIPRAAARDVINTWGRHENENDRMDLLHNDMNAIPAVDAIPVEWLMDLANRGDFVYSAVMRWKEKEMWERERG